VFADNPQTVPRKCDKFGKTVPAGLATRTRSGRVAHRADRGSEKSVNKGTSTAIEAILIS